jgi:tetratricopeptide (TPR) repeat protein
MAKKKRRNQPEDDFGADLPTPEEIELTDEFLSLLADERLLEKIVGKFLREQGLGKELSKPLEKAQELIYQAFELDDDHQRVALARKALRISPDCADAHVLLAEHAKTLEEAIKHFEAGVAAGERALGKEGFSQCEGHFWGVLETRPYMRARKGLADCLVADGRYEEAIVHYREMLRLNPNDNQGVRYLLASALLNLERHDDLEELLAQYEKDAAADWHYTRALVAFRRQGDSPQARRLLKQARRANKHVPAYLTGDKLLPPQVPSSYALGDEAEAITYAVEHLRHWRHTPGAVAWLRQVLRVPVEKPCPRPYSWSEQRWHLCRLPQRPGEVWQVDSSLEDSAVDPSGCEIQLWRLLIVNATDDTLVHMNTSEKPFSAPAAWKEIIQAMLRPTSDDPHRPERIEVRHPAWAKSWRGRLKQLDVELAECERLECCDRLGREMGPAHSVLRRLFGHDLATEVPLDDLPQVGEEHWQADMRRLGAWVEGPDGVLDRPWFSMVVNATEDKLLATEMTPSGPSADWFWQVLCLAMRQPAFGAPHRPGHIAVGTADLYQQVAPRLAELDIRCEFVEQLDLLDDIADGFSRRIRGENAPAPLIDVPGMTPQRLASFYAAAAEYYRRAPWRLVPGDVPIQVDCNKFITNRWYAVVTGQSGISLGLALYDSLEMLQWVLSGKVTDNEQFRHMAGLSLTYEEAHRFSPQDLNEVEKYGWPIAGPEAYPCATHFDPGFVVRPPLVWELELLTGCLWKIPDFLASQGATCSSTVDIGDGEIELRLEFANLDG